MTVGQQASSAVIDQTLTSLALQLRVVMEKLRNLNTQVNGQGNGTAYLEALGYSSTDAAAALNLVGYMSNQQGVYFGTATVSSAFNFDTALSVLWAGQ
jgi:hypothetical protein